MPHELLTLPLGRSALLLIDMQEEHRIDRRYLVEDYAAVAVACARLLAAARRAEMPVLHSIYLLDSAPRPFHPVEADGTSAFSVAGAAGSEISPEVAPLASETVIEKGDASCFSTPALGEHLKRMAVEWLVIAGCWSEACVAATVKDAVDRGIRVLLVKDACGSGSRAMHETAVLNMANRLYGGAVAATERAVTLIGGGAAQVWRTDLPVPVKFTYESASADYAAL